MDFSSMSTGQKIGVGSGIVLIINLFLPWYGVGPFSFNAFDAEFLAWGGSFVAIAGAVVLALTATGRADVSRGTLAPEQIALILGALGFVLVVLRWITESSATKFGLFLGIIAAAGVAYGSFQAMQEKGLEMPDMDDLKSIADGDDDEA